MSNAAKKTALVFGGSRGIGASIVTRLADDGFTVAFTYLSRPADAKALADRINSRGVRAMAIEADSGSPAAIGAAVEKVVGTFGKLDVVVVNAGIFKTGTVDSMSLDELDKMIDINFRGVFLSIQAAQAHLNDGGRVITIGSNTAIRTGHAGTSVYQATKAAVAGLVKGLALDFAPRRITVNNVQPGPTQTDIHDAASVEYLSNFNPLKRIGQPAEIAGLVSYLAGAESGYMTGSSLTIDGGYVL